LAVLKAAEDRIDADGKDLVLVAQIFDFAANGRFTAADKPII